MKKYHENTANGYLKRSKFEIADRCAAIACSQIRIVRPQSAIVASQTSFGGAQSTNISSTTPPAARNLRKSGFANPKSKI